jgi:hypothetical protein
MSQVVQMKMQLHGRTILGGADGQWRAYSGAKRRFAVPEASWTRWRPTNRGMPAEQGQGEAGSREVWETRGGQR